MSKNLNKEHLMNSIEKLFEDNSKLVCENKELKAEYYNKEEDYRKEIRTLSIRLKNCEKENARLASAKLKINSMSGNIESKNKRVDFIFEQFIPWVEDHIGSKHCGALISYLESIMDKSNNIDRLLNKISRLENTQYKYIKYLVDILIPMFKLNTGSKRVEMFEEYYNSLLAMNCLDEENQYINSNSLLNSDLEYIYPYLETYEDLKITKKELNNLSSLNNTIKAICGQDVILSCPILNIRGTNVDIIYNEDLFPNELLQELDYYLRLKYQDKYTNFIKSVPRLKFHSERYSIDEFLKSLNYISCSHL